jgi:1,4-dihydroxy-2-naphthoyl-CoA hydrolase
VPNASITPEHIAAVQAGTFPGNLAFRFLEVEEDRVRAQMTVDRRHLHEGGYVHGGAWTAFADTVAAWGTMRVLDEGQPFTTVELKMNVFSAARDGDVLEGIGTPLHLGRRTQVWEVRIARGERPVAHFVCTQMILDGGA